MEILQRVDCTCRFFITGMLKIIIEKQPFLVNMSSWEIGTCRFGFAKQLLTLSVALSSKQEVSLFEKLKSFHHSSSLPHHLSSSCIKLLSKQFSVFFVYCIRLLYLRRLVHCLSSSLLCVYHNLRC